MNIMCWERYTVTNNASLSHKATTISFTGMREVEEESEKMSSSSTLNTQAAELFC